MDSSNIVDFYMRYNIVTMGIMTITAVATAIFVSYLVWKIYKLAQKHSERMEKYFSDSESETSKK